MNCWWVNHYACSLDEPGGTRHHTLARLLGDHGIDVTLLASSFHYSLLKDRLDPGEDWRVEMRDGVRYAWLRTRAYAENPIAKLRNMRSFAARLPGFASMDKIPSPDVIVGSSPHLYAADAARRLAAGMQVPFCCEIRDIWPESIVDVAGVSRWNPAVLHMGILERRIYRAASCIFTLLPGSEQHIVAKGGLRDAITWIPNGIDPQHVPAPHPPPGEAPFTAMYAGAHGLANGLECVVEAGRILQDDTGADAFRIRLVGDGPLKVSLQNHARMKAIEVVEFDDPVPKKDIYATLQEADACLLPLKPGRVFRYGISPNKMFDYMAAGRPVITAVDTPVNPVVDSGAGVSVAAGDPQALAAALIDMKALGREERVAMGERGRAAVLNQFNMGVLAERVAEALHGAAAG
ncbi:MAG: glycosyltransferase family 4 protein [Planctomycetota bacterium]|nr:glycosyltransferase family 4 protein [Planctomycetota bacterium]